MRYELAGLDEESLDVTLATLPMMHIEAPDVAYKAKGGKRGMKKEGKQATAVPYVAQS